MTPETSGDPERSGAARARGNTAYEAVTLSMIGAGSEGPYPGRPTVLGLEDQGRLVGAYRWIELQMFEVLGSWVGREHSDEACLLFDLHSQQHAWHAQVLADRLPVSWSSDRYESCAPGPGVQRAIQLVGAAEGTLLRLVGAGRFVLARLVAGYTLHIQRAAVPSDAPVLRVMRLVLRDELESWQATEIMLQSLLSSPEEAAAAAGHLRSLEEPVAGEGPGLVRWPLGLPGDDGA